MEYCIEARALKSSLLSQIKISKQQNSSSYDHQELWFNKNVVVNNHGSSDELFSIDDLLDLSDKEEFKDELEDFASVSSQDNDDSCNSMNSSSSSSSGDLVSLTGEGDDLPLPIDDMESLEWLSTIVDDSMSEHNTLLFPPAKLKEVTMNRFEPVVSVASHGFTVLGLPYPVPKKCRTERSRKAGRVWSSGSRSFTESSSNSSSSHDSSITSPMLMMNPVYITHLFEKQPKVKKQRKNPVQYNEPGSNESLSQRRCTHCQVQKTPQWRTGPLGPKTLCNACGVRYKSGRLFPEYRPACSPTFSVEVHSNSHRKVLEMRKKKDVEVGVEPGFVNIAVQSASS
ncbi:GATA transcription factor 5 [Artemisia annua]|uniref:GATA transcription factor n=1 Tax=Artemisia annua TaxID=35608 RepID=A0A2U1M741_ARTAN|nr:GATA transcription factor 5 [Artemisia annua]